MFLLAGLQEINLEIGESGEQQMHGAFFAFLPLIYGKDCSHRILTNEISN